MLEADPAETSLKRQLTMAVKPVPEGYHTVTPYLIVTGAGGLIDFVTQAFGGT
jgi:hypothetical protein